MAPGVPRETYRAALARALTDLRKFAPDLIAVSAGFDAYARDPLADGSLLAEDFALARRELRALNIPFFSLLEGTAGFAGACFGLSGWRRRRAIAAKPLVWWKEI